MNNTIPYSFIIDFAPNRAVRHYREMVAYMTGEYGDDGDGGLIAEFVRDPGPHRLPPVLLDWRPHIHRVHDGPWMKLCDFVGTPGLWNDGIGDIYTFEELDENPQRVLEDVQKNFFAISKDYPDFAEKAKNLSLENLKTYVAYYSLAVFMSSKPPSAVVNALKQRAAAFLVEIKDPSSKLFEVDPYLRGVRSYEEAEISGFRTLHTTSTSTPV